MFHEIIDHCCDCQPSGPVLALASHKFYHFFEGKGCEMGKSSSVPNRKWQTSQNQERQEDFRHTETGLQKTSSGDCNKRQQQALLLNIMFQFKIPVFSYSKKMQSRWPSSVSSDTTFKYYQTSKAKQLFQLIDGSSRHVFLNEMANFA